MRIVANVEYRFSRTPDGKVWTDGAFPNAYWQRHLEVFSGVLVIARVRDVGVADPRWTRADGESVHFLALPHYVGPLRYAAHAWEIRKILRQAPIQKDAILLRVPSHLASCLHPIVAGRNQPYAVQVGGDPWEMFSPGSIQHILRPFFRRLYSRRQKQQCLGACACAYVTRRTLQDRYPADTVAFQTHFSDALLPPEAFLKSRARPLRRVAPQRVITVAALEQPYKGIDVLIESTALCHKAGTDFQVVVIGDGCLRPELEHLARDRGVADRIKFAGSIASAAAIRDELDSSDLFVLPSRTEGLPRSLVEAMARGLPCIASAVGGVPELLAAEDLVPRANAPALAAKIAERLRSPRGMEMMSARNLAEARKHVLKTVEDRQRAFWEYLRVAATVHSSSLSAPISSALQGEASSAT